MTTREAAEIGQGKHWLCRLARELDTDAKREIEELDAWDWTAPEIALSLLDNAFPQEVTRASKITALIWPWEKRRILQAVAGGKLENWVREALIEKLMREEGGV